jgi:hypothetical protein
MIDLLFSEVYNKKYEKGGKKWRWENG